MILWDQEDPKNTELGLVIFHLQNMKSNKNQNPV